MLSLLSYPILLFELWLRRRSLSSHTWTGGARSIAPFGRRDWCVPVGEAKRSFEDRRFVKSKGVQKIQEDVTVKYAKVQYVVFLQEKFNL